MNKYRFQLNNEDGAGGISYQFIMVGEIKRGQQFCMKNLVGYFGNCPSLLR
jgi:hypothetical protein